MQLDAEKLVELIFQRVDLYLEMGWEKYEYPVLLQADEFQLLKEQAQKNTILRDWFHELWANNRKIGGDLTWLQISNKLTEIYHLPPANSLLKSQQKKRKRELYIFRYFLSAFSDRSNRQPERDLCYPLYRMVSKTIIKSSSDERKFRVGDLRHSWGSEYPRISKEELSHVLGLLIG